MRKTSARRNARQVPKIHKTNTTNVCAQLLTEKSQASAKPDIPLGTHTSAGRRPAAVGEEPRPRQKPRSGPLGSGGPRREKEARLLNLRRDRSELRHSGAHHITDGVVTQNLVAAATAAVQHLTTHAWSTQSRDPKDACGGGVARQYERGERGHGCQQRRVWP